MARTTTVQFTQRTSKALNTQKQFDQFGFPFTMNPTVGCFFACKYCYSPIFVSKIPSGKRRQFFETVRVKLDIPTLLDKQLTALKALPQHLKRVQINETSDYYLARVMNELNAQNRDVMLEILKVFENHATNGNTWMLHVLTKSNLILKHLPEYKQMREMVQIEISFATHDESIRKQIEFYTIPTIERLKVIEALAKNDIFVRTMAMPFFGGAQDLQILKDLTFNAGARAFKNKGLNYYSWQQLAPLTYADLVQDKIQRTQGQPNTMNPGFIVHSGETLMINGQTQPATVLMPQAKSGKAKLPDWAAPTKMASRLQTSSVTKIDCGYSQISKINWGYIV